MSYCVNCGVKLSDSEKKCPLCGTEVINPNKPWKEPNVGPYPKRVEHIVRKVDTQYGAILASLLLIIPVGVTLFADTIADNKVGWSLWVLGAATVIFFFSLFPLLCKRKRPYLYLVIDTFVLGIYLWLISCNTTSDWYFSLGLPLVLLVGCCVCASVYTFRRSRLAIYVKWAVQFLITGLLSMGIEIIINKFLQKSPIVNWSVYPMITFIIFSIIMLILNRKKNLQEEIRKRLYI